jgi:hypothetical protein
MSTSTQKKKTARTKNKRAELRKGYVPAAALARSVEFDAETMHVRFADGRVLSVPLLWFPNLLSATPKQRQQYEIGGGGISLHWPKLDEDLSIAGLMAGVDLRSA